MTAKHLTLVSKCLTTLSLMVFTQRNFVADFLEQSEILHRKLPFCDFNPPSGGLGTTYDVRLRLIEKCIVSVNFLLGVTAEALQMKTD